MSTPKGYPTQEKDERLKAEFATVEPVRELQHGLSVLAHQYVREVTTDAVEANSTTILINATAHSALKGDVIRFTSGALSGYEVKVFSVATNSITLAEELPSAPALGVTFSINRHKYPTVDANGNVLASIAASGPVQFVRDGLPVEVTEDTVTPANNLPLPVKLTGITGDISITAQNLDVQSTHTGANPDSMRIGDGTETVSVTASNQLEVAVTAALPAGTNNIGDVDVLTEPATAADGGALPATTKVVSGYDGTNVQVIKTDSSGELQVDVLSQPALSHSTDSVKIGDGTEFASVTASNQLEVAVTASLPAGTNAIGKLSANDGVDIGDVTINNAAGASAVNIQDGGNSITVDGAVTVSATDLDIRDLTSASDSVTAVQGGAWSSRTQDGSGNNINSTGNALNVAVTQALPAGTNNIGDVDVLTQPARSHTTDSIRIGDGTDLANVTAANQLEVAITASLPAGTNAIGKLSANSGVDIGDVTVDNGAGASAVNIQDGGNSITVDGTVAATQSGNWSVRAQDGAGNALTSSTVGAAVALNTSERGHTLSEFVRNDYSSVNVTTAAYTQLIASTTNAYQEIEIFDSSGQTLKLATGAAASEVDKFLIFPGGNGRIKFFVAAGTRISIRAVSATANSGEVSINFYG